MNMAMKEKEKWRKNGWKELTISPGGTPGFFWYRRAAKFSKFGSYFRPKNVIIYTRFQT